MEYCRLKYTTLLLLNFSLNYIPLVTSVVIITFFITVGPCIALPILRIFRKDSIVNIVSIIFGLFFCTCVFLELGIDFNYYLAQEFEPLINQLRLIERKSKFFYKIVESLININLSDKSILPVNISDYKVNKHDSIDCIGLFYFVMNMEIFTTALFLPFTTTIIDLDSFCLSQLH